MRRKRTDLTLNLRTTTEEDSKISAKRSKEDQEEEEGGTEGESTPAAKRSKGDEESTPNSAGHANMSQYPNYPGAFPSGFPPMPYMAHPMAYMGMPQGAFPNYQNTPMPLPPKSSKKQRQSEEKSEDGKSGEYGSPFPGMFPPPPPHMMMPYGFPGFMPMFGGPPHRYPSGKPRSAGIVLSMSCDTEQLSEYQILVRRQLEIFEATQEDVESNTQGRKKPVLLGQVGLRCRHCASYPLRARGRGAVYYPAKLFGVYQAAQNMAGRYVSFFFLLLCGKCCEIRFALLFLHSHKFCFVFYSHLCQACQHIPAQIKMELRKLRVRRDNASGGKQYWADGCRALGIYEDGTCLRLEKKPAEGEVQDVSQTV